MTKITLHNFEQRSEEWAKIRIGKVGGSEAIGLTTTARMKTMLPLKLAEVVTGEDQGKDFVNEDLQRGIDLEPLAVAEYEKKEFLTVKQLGYITNSDYERLGISPDGLVMGAEKIIGAIEIKAPQAKGHIATILENQVPATHRPQVAHLFFMIEDIEWVDFISYCPNVKTMPYFKIRVEREEYASEIKKIADGNKSFETKMNEGITILKHI
jgi:hypothetical protein